MKKHIYTPLLLWMAACFLLVCHTPSYAMLPPQVDGDICFETCYSAGTTITIDVDGKALKRISGMEKVGEKQFRIIDPHNIRFETTSAKNIILKKCGITKIDLSRIQNARFIDVSLNYIAVLDLSSDMLREKLERVLCYQNGLYKLILNPYHNIKTLDCSLNSFNLNYYVNSFPKAYHEVKLIAYFDGSIEEHNIINPETVKKLKDKNYTVQCWTEKESKPIPFAGKKISEEDLDLVSFKSALKKGESFYLRAKNVSMQDVTMEVVSGATKKGPDYYIITDPSNVTLRTHGLWSLTIQNAAATEIRFERCFKLRELHLPGNCLKNVNLKSFETLEELNLSDNFLYETDLSMNQQLREVYLSGNKIGYIEFPYGGIRLTKIDVSSNSMSAKDMEKVCNSIPRTENGIFIPYHEEPLKRCNHINKYSLDLLSLKGWKAPAGRNKELLSTPAFQKMAFLCNKEVGDYLEIKSKDGYYKSNDKLKLRHYSYNDKTKEHTHQFLVLEKNPRVELSIRSVTSFTIRNQKLKAVSTYEETPIVALDLAYNELENVSLENAKHLKTLNVYSNKLTYLKITNSNLELVNCAHNNLKREGFYHLITNLPDRSTKHTKGTLICINTETENNKPSEGNYKDAQKRGWKLMDTNEKELDFTKKYTITTIKQGEGQIRITGYNDLNAVPEGTQLTVEVYDVKAGWELTTLTANGKDIRSTKKFVVDGEMTIKAVFTEVTANNKVSGQTTKIKRIAADKMELTSHQEGTYKLYTVSGELLSSGALTAKQVLELPTKSHAILLISYANGQTETYKL